jgi:hypothetical protein
MSSTTTASFGLARPAISANAFFDRVARRLALGEKGDVGVSDRVLLLRGVDE